MSASGLSGRRLDAMRAGGIYDHIGFGFHRYSTDRQWLVPHFEKMLYDNAQLASLYLDASLAAPAEDRPRMKEIARGIFTYVLRDMTSPDGAFYSAEDAQSEGHEGKFYTWTKAEMETVLTAEEASFAVSYFGLTESGNFEDHSHPTPLKNQNVLSIVDWRKPLTPAESESLRQIKTKLAEIQQKRIRPHRDDKVLASWNGLMLSALARGSMILQDDALLSAATKTT